MDYRFRYSLQSGDEDNGNTGWRFQHSDWLGNCRPLRSPKLELRTASFSQLPQNIDELFERL